MKLSKGKITILDFVTKNEKNKLDNSIKQIIDGEVPKSSNWIQTGPMGGGSFQEWSLTEIPESISFMSEVKIRVINYARFSFMHTIQMSGFLSSETIEEIESGEINESRTKIETLRKRFWSFWKGMGIGAVSDSKDNFRFDSGCGFVNFYFEAPDFDEICKLEHDKTSDEFSKEFREKPFMRKYGVNYGGLISISEYFANKISVIAQGASIFSNYGYDFSWIIKLEFSQESKLFDGDLFFSSSMENSLETQLLWLWTNFRISQIHKWKTKLDVFNKEISTFQEKITLSKKDFGPTPLIEKSSFLLEFSSIIDETRYISKFVEGALEHDLLPRPEISITGGNIVTKNYGFFFNILDYVNKNTKIIDEEYGVLNNQYKILSEHLKELVSFAQTKSSQSLENTNIWTQRILVGSAILTAIATVVILSLTGTLVSLTEEMLGESESTSKILEALERSNGLMLASLYQDFELELEYEIHPFKRDGDLGGTYWDLKVTNIGKYDSLVKSSWYLNEELCNVDNSNYYLQDRVKLVREAFYKEEVIERNESKLYRMDVPKFYSNYTNLKPFAIEIVSEGNPAGPDREKIDFFYEKNLAKIHFVYDPELKNWIPENHWEHVICDREPRQGTSFITITTTNPDQFRNLR
ncbi:hypothetical protein NKOR_06985 [Candidatus Nitrosopumilus koreensis AR1]|uniref:Uncharacterized protein n=1 Tax=Candidatus Nitrosopumilus koreensis AR1 TaxID=1229908 RepID=K0B516_9ARCH|nr:MULTISPECIES: hypothetical protein [Nitrosopumilus]AFS81268.1 hypothetical protein NKOR_06985 [Candidatus Nitrosopumilus koreensis AR1]